MTDEASKPDQAKPQGSGPKRRKQIVGAGVAFGIGSAAVVAALLYVNRKGGSDRGNKS